MFSCLVGERELGCNWELGFLRVFLYTIVSPYFIVKSLQLRGCRQIAEPRKYCLVRVIVFFDVCFLYLFCFSQVGILVKIPYTVNNIAIDKVACFYRSGIDRGEEEEDKDKKTKKLTHRAKILEVGFVF